MPRTIAKPSPISDGINRRFFEAIEAIVSLGKVSALEAAYLWRFSEARLPITLQEYRSRSDLFAGR